MCEKPYDQYYANYLKALVELDKFEHQEFKAGRLGYTELFNVAKLSAMRAAQVYRKFYSYPIGVTLNMHYQIFQKATDSNDLKTCLDSIHSKY